jgi:hypothetical protein
MRRSMLTFSSLALAALLCFASHKYFGIGRGMMERLAAYPVTIWLVTFGLYILKGHDHAEQWTSEQRVKRDP